MTKRWLLGMIVMVCIALAAADSYAFRPGMGYGCSPYDGQPCNIPEQHIDRFELGQGNPYDEYRSQERLNQRRMVDEMERQSRVLEQQRADQRTRTYQESYQPRYQNPYGPSGRWAGCDDGMC